MKAPKQIKAVKPTKGLSQVPVPPGAAEGPKHKDKLPKTGPKDAPKNYAKEPSVPAKKKADQPLVPSVTIMIGVPNMVPRSEGSLPGVNGKPTGGFTQRPTHGFGHSAINRAGHLRLSGHSGSHRIGKK